LIQRLTFVKIYEVDFDFCSSFEIGLAFEVKPLGVAIGINIILKYKVVFSFGTLDCNCEISTFEN